MTKGTILMLKTKYYGMSGHDVVINNLCLGLEKLGYDTAIGSFDFLSEPPDNIRKVKLKWFKNLGNAQKKMDFDIIHNHQTIMNYYSLTISKPFIFHYHGTANRIQELNLKTSLLLCSKKITKIIAVSNSASNKLREFTDNIQIEIIHNGVDTNFYHPNLERRFKKGDPQLLFVGNLYPYKNVLKLIHIIPELKKIFPSIHFQIVGEGNEYQRLYKEIMRNGLSDCVELVGGLNKDELKFRYASCDVYVSASMRETSDIPLLEAMSCGKPVVVSDIPAHREIIDGSKAGLVFSFNESEMVEKIRLVYHDREKFVSYARKFAELNDWSNTCAKLAKNYEQLM